MLHWQRLTPAARRARLFAVASSRLPGAGKVAAARQKAFEAYESLGLPHRRIEDWKYTDLRVLMREVLPLAAAPDQAALAKAAEAMKAHAVADACRLVLVDGVFAPQLSDLTALEKGLRVQSLREALDAGSDQSADLLKTTTDAMMIAQCCHGDRWRRRCGGRWRRAEQAGSYHSRHHGVIGLRVHAFARADREGRTRYSR